MLTECLAWCLISRKPSASRSSYYSCYLELHSQSWVNDDGMSLPSPATELPLGSDVRRYRLERQ